MTPQSPGEIRARKRPLTIVSLALVRLASGATLALPLAAVIESSGIGARAEGDRALFQDGGYLLLELLRLQSAELGAVAGGLWPLLLLLLSLQVLCNAVLLVSLNSAGRLELFALLSRALRHVPAFMLLGAFVLLTQGAVLLFGMLVSESVPESMTSAVQSDAGKAFVLLLALLGAGAVGGAGDVTKATLVRHGAPLMSSLGAALRCARRRPLPSLLGWLPFAALGLAAIAGAAWLTGVVDVSQPGAVRWIGVFALHQIVILSLVALRAAWYARALRLSAAHAF